MKHSELVDIAEKWVLKRCGFAFKELTTFAGETPDVIGFRSGDTILIECKVSRADFLQDKKKHFRRRPKSGVGSFRFYMCPKGLIIPEELPEQWGLIYVNDKGIAKQKIGPEGNVWSFPSDFYFTDRNIYGENAIMYSALRRLHIHGVIPLIYK